MPSHHGSWADQYERSPHPDQSLRSAIQKIFWNFDNRRCGRCVQSEQLLAERQNFEDEVLAGVENREEPTQII